MKLVVMIPAYNEETTVGLVVEGISRRIERMDSVEVLLVDDGSTDSTIQEARKSGVDFVFRHEKNMGLGVTFRNGLNRALDMGADIILSIDADMQYCPSEIPLLLKPILEGEADIVLGNRQVGSLDHMPVG
ncbi:MAG: glycosyltransferase family 2 protein, partial [Thermoplasmata archaeon]